MLNAPHCGSPVDVIRVAGLVVGRKEVQDGDTVGWIKGIGFHLLRKVPLITCALLGDTFRIER